MRPSGDSLDLVILSSDGEPVSAVEIGGAMVADLESMPPFEHKAVATDGKVTLPAPDGPFGISLPLAVKGFGHVYVRADNRGVGYNAAEVGGATLNFCLEAAESRIAAVSEAESRFRNAGSSFSSVYRVRMSSAEAFLSDARRNSSNHVVCARLAMASLCESMHAGESLVVEHARNRIASSPARADFHFGCAVLKYPDRGERYAQLFAALLNFATLPFYRNAVEHREGVRNFDRIERILEWTKRDGLEAKGHPLVYLEHSGLPDWLCGKSYEEAKVAHRDYILDVVKRFQDRIRIWDVINEAHDWANTLDYDLDQLVELTRLAADSAREANPHAVRIVNSCCTWSEYVARGRNYYGPINRPARSVPNYLRDIIDAGVDFEVVGLQMYYPAQDMFEIDHQLERFCALGKPVHITELGVSCSPDPQRVYGELRKPSPHYWHGRPWSESEQADWIEAFYTICYSKPGIEAVSWWNFSEPSSVPHSALVRQNLEPKEGYRRLQKLIEGWRRPTGSPDS